MKYRPTGVCSKEIQFDLDDQNRIHNVRFLGGCNGNLQGIASLVEGMEVEDAIHRLSGINVAQKLHPARISLQKHFRQARMNKS